jgi:hypothetical protein
MIPSAYVGLIQNTDIRLGDPGFLRRRRDIGNEKLQ